MGETPRRSALARRAARTLGSRIEQLDRTRRHHRRDGMLVDQLHVAVPAQQHREIVEPADDALQLHAVHQKHGDRGLGLADVIEKNVLDVLRLVGGHSCGPFFSYFIVIVFYFYPVLLWDAEPWVPGGEEHSPSESEINT